jgi:hypothetical protein
MPSRKPGEFQALGEEENELGYFVLREATAVPELGKDWGKTGNAFP